MITINGKNIIKVYVGNKPCSQVYRGVNPLFDDGVDIQGLESFDYEFFDCDSDITYKDNGAIVSLYGNGNSWFGACFSTDILEENKNYKVSFKCSANSRGQSLYLEVGSDYDTYVINTTEGVIEKTFSNVDSNIFYMELGCSSSAGRISKITIKDFKLVEV